MIENNFVKKMVKGIRSGKKPSLTDRSIMHPEREWFSSVMLGLVLLVIGGYWSLSVYQQFNSVNLEAVTNESDSVVYRDSLVEAALFEINRRAQTYESLKAAAPFVAPQPAVPEVVEAEPAPLKEESPVSAVADDGEGEITFE
ncbi:MAG TPA: hypothetical protein PKA42_00090 [Candidatus Paceibacterota bacterium]|nr:hypothetical protein [Candidatus Paceibacterota bacterium]HMO82546.1 hypothetical protein [Candidatus Paceibacterota bacterium]